jgi:hypothetical protein
MGNGITGTLLNGASWTSGIRGTALNLDGVDDYFRFFGLGAPAGGSKPCLSLAYLARCANAIFRRTAALTPLPRLAGVGGSGHRGTSAQYLSNLRNTSVDAVLLDLESFQGCGEDVGGEFEFGHVICLYELIILTLL